MGNGVEGGEEGGTWEYCLCGCVPERGQSEILVVVSVERGDETAAEGIVVSKKRRCHAGAANLHIDPGKEAYRSGRREHQGSGTCSSWTLMSISPKDIERSRMLICDMREGE